MRPPSIHVCAAMLAAAWICAGCKSAQPPDATIVIPPAPDKPGQTESILTNAISISVPTHPSALWFPHRETIVLKGPSNVAAVGIVSAKLGAMTETICNLTYRNISPDTVEYTFDAAIPVDDLAEKLETEKILRPHVRIVATGPSNIEARVLQR